MRPLANRSFDPEIARHRLLERRAELVQRHRDTVATESELLADKETDLPDVAANRSAAAVLDKLGDAELLRLRRIQTALERLDDGSYGSCIVCGRPIAAARLEAMPESDRCEHCHNSH